MPKISLVPGPFASVDELERLYSAFDAAAISPTTWSHKDHVALAARFAMWYDEPEATDKMREGILRLNAANCVLQTATTGYHETLTRFYMWAVRQHLHAAGLRLTLPQLVNDTIRAMDNRDLPLRYYSRERLLAWTARTTWVEPDLRPLEGA